MPFGAKDIFYSAGLRTEAGSKVMAGFVPDYDATAVARLKDAGAVLVGKLHTTEFATSDPAPTRNPWNLACTPGGSSSGSAAAVAARMVPLALGSQTIGSNVRPASYCGLVGLKPTFGRISTRGVMALSYTQDHVGLMARSVEDIALGLAVTAGHDPDDPSSSRAPVPDYLAALTRRRAPRVGLLREFFFERATAGGRRHHHRRRSTGWRGPAPSRRGGQAAADVPRGARRGPPDHAQRHREHPRRALRARRPISIGRPSAARSRWAC